MVARLSLLLVVARLRYLLLLIRWQVQAISSPLPQNKSTCANNVFCIPVFCFCINLSPPLEVSQLLPVDNPQLAEEPDHLRTRLHTCLKLKRIIINLQNEKTIYLNMF